MSGKQAVGEVRILHEKVSGEAGGPCIQQVAAFKVMTVKTTGGAASWRSSR